MKSLQKIIFCFKYSNIFYFIVYRFHDNKKKQTGMKYKSNSAEGIFQFAAVIQVCIFFLKKLLMNKFRNLFVANCYKLFYGQIF